MMSGPRYDAGGAITTRLKDAVDPGSGASRDVPGRLLLVQSGYRAADGYGLNWFLLSG